jgi:hypothetical protein
MESAMLMPQGCDGRFNVDASGRPSLTMTFRSIVTSRQASTPVRRFRPPHVVCRILSTPTMTQQRRCRRAKTSELREGNAPAKGGKQENSHSIPIHRNNDDDGERGEERRIYHTVVQRDFGGIIRVYIFSPYITKPFGLRVTWPFSPSLPVVVLPHQNILTRHFHPLLHGTTD